MLLTLHYYDVWICIINLFFFKFTYIVSVIKNWISVFHWFSHHDHGISAIIPCCTNLVSICVISGGIFILALF